MKQGRPPRNSEKGAVRCCRQAMRGYNSELCMMIIQMSRCPKFSSYICSLHSSASTPSEAIVYISIEYWRLLQSINFHKICLQFTKVQKEMLSRIIWRHCLEHISSVYLSIHTVRKSPIVSENSIFKNEKEKKMKLH